MKTDVLSSAWPRNWSASCIRRRTWSCPRRWCVMPPTIWGHSTRHREGGGPVHYGVTPLARRQLADKLKIPYAYFRRMREDQPACSTAT